MSSVNFNLFTWIREGVRQSVLLGVSDALQQIGTTPDAQEIDPRLMSGARPKLAELVTDAGTANHPTRKRLGRTLRDLEIKDAGGPPT